MKRKYDELELEIVSFDAEDIITTSCSPYECGDDIGDEIGDDD